VSFGGATLSGRRRMRVAGTRMKLVFRQLSDVGLHEEVFMQEAVEVHPKSREEKRT
jgi:hypothetical protein